MTEARRRYLRFGAMAAGGLALAIAAVGLVEYFGSTFLSGRSGNTGVGSATVGTAPFPPQRELAAMSLHDAPQTIPDLRFNDGGGRPITLADFRGKVVLLNIWATWCGPCRREMPTLDRLQATLGGPDFEVVALSIDRAGIGVVTEFYEEVGVEHLAKYIDESGKASRQLNAVGLPTTLLIDREGREIGRHVGPAEWDRPEMIGFFQQQLSHESGTRRPGAGRQRASERPDRPAVASARPGILRPAHLDFPVTGDTTSSETI